MSLESTVAWGEIGLDFHIFNGIEYASHETQYRTFKRQIELALAARKPMIIHTREAEKETLEIMKEMIPKDWKLHVHCFTDSIAFAEELLAHFPNLWIGFTGVITFRSAKKLQQVVKRVPLNRILLETDGPSMTPEPFRGQPCHSGHIPLIAEKVALLKGVPVEEVYQVTNQNCFELFGF
eukprot:TRINITY_DN8461_c0_g1_i1.p1 TRINITY_DN8461_c0_g1~~TRINITY_DN8461_c0_g1_i1.p1  ORF type:complete len:180 (-),score=38.41 TRINITY_DN8461_c0_g1_i1:100-639(-)